MRKYDSEFGVSPVIGVVIMVAITVIMGVVISTFFLDITERFSDSGGSASVDFQQNLDNINTNQYSVIATLDRSENADYVVISSVNTSSEISIGTSYVGESNNNELRPSNVDYAPDNVEDSASVESPAKGTILLRNGDKANITGVVAGDKIQVFAGLDGEEKLVRSYTVRDALPD